MVVKLDRKTVAELIEEAEKLTPRELYVLTSRLIRDLKADYALALSEELTYMPGLLGGVRVEKIRILVQPTFYLTSSIELSIKKPKLSVH